MVRYEEVEALVAAWQDALASRVEAREVAWATCYSYSRGVGRYLAWCKEGNYPWAAEGSVREWQRELLDQGFAPSSVNTWAAGLKAFFAWAVAQGALAEDPTKELGYVATDVSNLIAERLPLADDEVLRVLQSPDDSEIGRRDRAILALMAYAAARTIDIQRATIGGLRIDPDGLLLHLLLDGEELVATHAHAISAVRAWLDVHPLADEAEAPLFVALGNRARGERLTTRAIRRIVKERFRQAGIVDPRKTAHSLRCSAISNALRRGASLYRVRIMSRHRSLGSLSK
ncbi:MAG: tyrosine-type recombinase/integrase, partial [Chloroflexi bacterium]|nr:tyrosine-type recombinase/integrase [Chloroflexota bacterium]